MRKEARSRSRDAAMHDDDNRLPDGTLIVDRTAFKDACWLDLEKAEKPLLYKVADKNFGDDQTLRKYLRVCFENLLQKMIYDLTPGLETRKKQLDRILPDICKKNECSKDAASLIGLSMGRILCVLQNSHKEFSPPDRYTLKKLTDQIKTPELHWSRKTKSERGPSVNDDEMKAFVCAILQVAGGAVYYDDLMDLIMNKFHLRPLRFSSDRTMVTDADGESEVPIWDILERDSDKFPIGYEHKEAALNIWKEMTVNDKNLFRDRFVYEKKGNEVASTWGVSPATISQRLNEMERVFHMHFKGAGFTYEECQAVLDIIKELAMRESS